MMEEQSSAQGNGASGLRVAREICHINQSNLQFTLNIRFSQRPRGRSVCWLCVQVCMAAKSPAAGWAVRGAVEGCPEKRLQVWCRNQEGKT